MASITARRQPSAGSQAALAPLRPQLPGKNLHVCVLNPAGLVPRQGAFANPQVDDLQGFGLLSLAELRRKHASFFRASRTKGARNSPSQVRMPAPGAAPPSARSIRPTMPQAPAAPSPPCPRHLRHPAHRAQALAGLGLSAPGTFGFHTAVRQSPTVCHTPRLLAHVVSHAIACNATWFRTVFNPAPRAPTASSPPRPKHLQHPAHRLPHNARPYTRGFPRSCVRCNLVLHGFQPTAPTGAACQTRRSSPLRFPTQRPGHLRHAKRHAPSLLRRPARHARRCYLFGATLSSSQAHRNAKATRTSAPPAYPMTPTPRLLTTTPPRAEPPPIPRLKMPE